MRNLGFLARGLPDSLDECYSRCLSYPLYHRFRSQAAALCNVFESIVMNQSIVRIVHRTHPQIVLLHAKSSLQ